MLTELLNRNSQCLHVEEEIAIAAINLVAISVLALKYQGTILIYSSPKHWQNRHPQDNVLNFKLPPWGKFGGSEV